MTNYLRILPLALLAAGCARAADTPKPPAAKSPPAATAARASPAPHYSLAPNGGTLDFTFVQEGAATQAKFRQLAVDLAYDEKNPAASSLDVKIQMASVFTDYDQRDEEIRGPTILDVKKFPVGEFRSTSLVKSENGIEAVGRLTVHGVTRDLRIPLVIRPATVAGKPGLELSGSTQVRRLDFGVGTEDWASTDTVQNEIKLSWKLQLAPAAR